MADSYVCSGAMMTCTMGSCPAKLTILPTRMVNLAGHPQANIGDHKTMENLAPFGLCRSLSFPPTVAATAAALGTLTPMPCMHNTPLPWMGGKTDHLIKGLPALLKSCKCQCMWGGIISLVTDGQENAGTQDMQETPFLPIVPPKERDRIVLWDAYWEATLEKNNQPQKQPTKLRFIPFHKEVDLNIIFYFEKEGDDAYDKKNAEFVLKFEIPGTQYEVKEYGIKGADLLYKSEKIVSKERTYYKCTIKKFSSDLTKARFPHYFEEKNE